MSASVRPFVSSTARKSMPALFARATPDLYRSNAFRLTGMTVEASSRELTRFGERIALQERIGAASSAVAGAFPIIPPPTSRDLRDVLQRLNDPEQRLLDEFFWFWPMQAGSSGSDTALQALVSGDQEKAKRIWLDVTLRGFGSDGSAPAAARSPAVATERLGIGAALHNLAVLSHLSAVENDEAALAASNSPVNPREEYEWRAAYQRWNALLIDDAAWQYLVNRIRALDDPRLPPEYSRQLRKGLPAFLLMVQGALVRRAAERGAVARAALHVGIIERSGFEPAIIADCFRHLVESDGARLKTMCETAVAESKADPGKGAKKAERLLEEAKPILQQVSACLPPEHGSRVEAYDQVAGAALSCLARFGNTTEDWKTVLPLTEAVLKVASSAALRERVARSLQTARENLELSICWFCQDRQADNAASIPTEMYGDVQPEYRFPEGARLSWKHQTVSIPRCIRCRDVHARIGSLTTRWCVTGAVVGVVGCTAVTNSGGGFGLVVLVACIALGVFIGRRMGWASAPAGMKPGSAAHQFPTVVALMQRGWRLGAKPPNVN